MRRWIVGVILGVGLVGCDSGASEGVEEGSVDVVEPGPSEDVLGGSEDAETGSGGDVQLRSEDVPGVEVDRFSPGVMPESLKGGGYIDSPFINKAGDRIYFIHSIFSPRVLDGSAAPDECSHVQVPQLPGHATTPGLEWNTDIYYVEWNGAQWAEPTNLGAPINSLGMECCMWLNDDETELIFNRVSDLDGDGKDGDMGLSPTGNYIATRADRNASWSEPVPLPGAYGIQSQTTTEYRHDIHKAPSGNLYLWEKFNNGDILLRFGARTGGTYSDPIYADPVTINGSTNYETQVWVNDSETQLVFNHRQANGETDLYTQKRATKDEPWEPATAVSLTGFTDSNGSAIWGEPSFDQSENFMVFVRFDTTEAKCWTPVLMVSPGNISSGFSTPTTLN